jgi:hypothetical protein
MLIFLKVLAFACAGVQLFSTLQLYRYEKRKRVFRLPAPCVLPNGLMGTKLSYFVQEGPGNRQKRIFWFCCASLTGASVILCICIYQYLQN